MAQETSEKVKILNWLRQHGYPLELRVGQVLRDAGWYVEHAYWYTDPETGKSRELDLKATLYAATASPRHVVSLAVAIECKSSTDKPWVVFTSPRDPMSLSAGTTAVADHHSRDILHAVPSHIVKRPAILETHRTIGHGVTKAFSDNKTGDPTSPFSALRSVASAAYAIGERNAKLFLMMAEAQPTAELVIPLVLLDGALYEFFLNDREEEALRKAKLAQIVVAHPVTGATSVVSVVTRDYFPAFVESLTPDCTRFCTELIPHVGDALVLTRSRIETARKRTDLAGL